MIHCYSFEAREMNGNISLNLASCYVTGYRQCIGNPNLQSYTVHRKNSAPSVFFRDLLEPGSSICLLPVCSAKSISRSFPAREKREARRARQNNDRLPREQRFEATRRSHARRVTLHPIRANEHPRRDEPLSRLQPAPLGADDAQRPTPDVTD